MMETLPLLACLVEPSPVVELHRAFTSAKLSERESFDFNPHHQKIRLFLDDLSLHPCHDVLNKNKVTPCRCLAGIVIGEGLKDKVVVALLKHEFYSGIQMHQELLLPAKVGTNWMNEIYNQLELEEPPGMKDIKWIELYSKIGKYVPPEKKALWKYYHTDPGTVRKDKVSMQAKQSRKQRKERSTTK
jgi:hypothetical protein